MDFLQFLFSKKFLKHLLIAIGILILLLWLTFKSLSWYTKHSDYIIVPDFRGQYIHEVLGSVDNRNYQFSIIDSIFDSEKSSGSILSQDPYPGSKVKKNRMIYLTITTVIPEKTTMPDLRDLTLRQAQTMLESSGLKLGRILYIRSFDEDAVQNQLFEGHSIRAGTVLDKGSSIDLTVGMGAKAAEIRMDSVEFDSLQ